MDRRRRRGNKKVWKIKPFLNSLRFKLFAACFVIIVPLITLLIINNYYSVQVVRNQVAQSNKNMLSLYMGQIDRNLAEVDKYLLNQTASNLYLLDLEFPKKSDEDRYNLAKLGLFNFMVEDIAYYPMIDLFFVYSKPNQDLMVMTGSLSLSTKQRDAVQQEIMDMVRQNTDNADYSRWHVWKGKEDYSIYHLIKTGEVYIGSWVNSSKLMVPLNLIDLGESGAAVLTTDRMEPISNADRMQDIELDLNFPKDSYTITGNRDGKYLVLGEPSAQGDFNLVAMVPESAILEKLPYLQRISSAISIIAALFLLLFLFMMRKVFLDPVKRIVIAMRKLRDGNWDSRLEQVPTSTEFEIVNETFNRMINEIHDLKINVYEEKLNHQRAELRQLQLQINPHFFLNSLNIIYNLATVKDFALIHEMTKCLVSYFRFMFRSKSYFVSLKDELSHTSNYLRIQQLRFPGTFSYAMEAPEDLLDTEVPPLIIQTMVENTIKYAVNMDYPISISVEVSKEAAGDPPCTVILIKDTGPGFPDEVLQKLASFEEQGGEDGEQIGIWNVRRRLRLLYQERASIEFSNDSSHGAVIQIRLPNSESNRR